MLIIETSYTVIENLCFGFYISPTYSGFEFAIEAGRIFLLSAGR